MAWDLSPDGTRLALGTFDYEAGDFRVIALAGGTPQKFSASPWAEWLLLLEKTPKIGPTDTEARFWSLHCWV